MTASPLDLSVSPRREIADQILSSANSLFDSVKSAPLAARRSLPEILRNNNFGIALRLTPAYAFLEVTTKLCAHKSRDLARLRVYRQIFTSAESGEHAIFKIDKARFARIGRVTLQGSRAFAIGSDFSFCAYEVRTSSVLEGKKSTHDIDIIYVVGFGENISAEDSWQEFDALIRVTLADWSRAR